MFKKYFEIKSVYERENKETKEQEVVIIANELRWKGIISSYTNYFVLTPTTFVEKFKNEIDKDKRNFGLERKNLEVDCEYSYTPNVIVSSDNLPESLK